MRRLVVSGTFLLLVLIVLFIWTRADRTETRLAIARANVGKAKTGEFLATLEREYPTHPEIPYLVARQARLEGRPLDVVKAIERAKKLGWDDRLLARERLMTLATVEPRGARNEVSRLLETHPEDSEVLLAVALCEIASGLESRAIERANAVLKREPMNNSAKAVRGKAYLQLRHLEEALIDLEPAASDPERVVSPQLKLDYASCLLELGRFAESNRLFRELRTSDPSSLVFAFGLGRSATYLAQYEEATVAYRFIIQQKPDHVETLLAIALAMELQGKIEEAIPYLESSLKVEPNRVETHSRLAKLFAMSGREADANRHQLKYLQLENERLKQSQSSTERRP